MTESCKSRNDAPKTDFEKWMDAVRPAWRLWKRDEHPACSQAQIAEMMCEAWNAGANTVESLRSETPASGTAKVPEELVPSVAVPQ